jgi:RimJ/RimL family protein N-acetyltransferase
VRLVDYGDGDLAFSIELETDPVVMADLGGPRAVESIERVHPKRVITDPADGIWQKIVTDSGEEAGQIGVWRSEQDGEELWEMGWMLLPAFHGQGLGSAALATVLGRMRRGGSYDVVHAFPGVTNGPSNALCRKFGFELIRDFWAEGPSGRLHCNHWRLELA